MSYRIWQSEDSLVIEVNHEPHENADRFYEPHVGLLKVATRVLFRVWEFDGDSATVGLIQKLHSLGVDVRVTGETPRAREVMRVLGWL